MAFGIICEYNPFHNGHLRQINEIKKLSDEPIICVMSGNFTQRGEIAITDKYSRAKMALCAGADAVLELPVPFSIASAEYFASAGVHILNGAGVDKLCFGSESADAEKIYKIAHIACSEEFKRECADISKKEGNAAAYFDLLQLRSGEEGILSNDILGIEYTKAIIKNNYPMQIYPIKREGSAYRDTELCAGELPSASAIRETVKNGSLDDISSYVPSSTLEILKSCELADIRRIFDGMLLSLRLADAEGLEVAISDIGLVNRILALSRECTDFDTLEAKLQTKKYTKSSIRRAMLYILLGVKQSDLDCLPSKALLLGANEKGREYLSSIRKNEKSIRIVTKPADYDVSEPQKKADALYTMCFENKKESGFYLKGKPVIIK